MKKQREGRSKRETARGWAREALGDEEGWKERRNGTRGRERRKRSVSCPALSVVLLLPWLFLCFPLLLVRDIPGAVEEREERRYRGRERREENGEVLRFFWMSQARVRRRGKDEQETAQRRGSGRKRRRKRKKHRSRKRGAREREREKDGGKEGEKERERGGEAATTVA